MLSTHKIPWRFAPITLITMLVLLLFSSVFVAARDNNSISQRPFSTDGAWNDMYSMGAGLFEENCVACHGDTGQGGYGLPLNLQSFLRIADTNYLIRSMQYGRPVRGMPAYEDILTDVEIKAIALFIKSWQYQPSLEISTEPISGNVEEGRDLFNGLCTGCHGIDGEGGPEVGGGHVIGAVSGFSGPALIDPGFLKSATDGYIKATLMYGRVGTPMGAYLKGRQGFVELREEEIDSIVAYLRSQELGEEDETNDQR